MPERILMILMNNLHAGENSDWGTLTPNTPACNSDLVYQDVTRVVLIFKSIHVEIPVAIRYRHTHNYISRV